MERPTPEQINALIQRFAQEGPSPELLEAIDRAFRALFPDQRQEPRPRLPLTQGPLPLEGEDAADLPEALPEQGPLPLEEDLPPDPEQLPQGLDPEPEAALSRAAACRALHQNLIRAIARCGREPYVRDTWAIQADLGYDPVADCTARLQLLLDPDGLDCRVKVRSDLRVPPGREAEALALCLRWNRQVGYPRARAFRPGSHAARRLELVFTIPHDVLADGNRLFAFLRPHLDQAKACWRYLSPARSAGLPGPGPL